MPTYHDPITGHKLSPHAHDFEDGDERPLPPRKVKPLFTVNEVFGWLCSKQKIDPDYISDTRFRWWMDRADETTAQLMALYAHALTAKIEAIYNDGLPDFSGVNAVQNLLAKETK